MATAGASVTVKIVELVCCTRDDVLGGLAEAVSPTMLAHCAPPRSMTPMPKTALAEAAGGAATKAPPALKWRTTSGRKPTPVTALLPGADVACQLTTLADTCGPPMAR